MLHAACYLSLFFTDAPQNISLNKLKNKKLFLQNVTQYASEIAKSKKIRMLLKKYQKKFSKHNHVCIEGRDIGNIICPNADIKLFFKCNLKTRAKRRWSEYRKIDQKIPQHIMDSLLKSSVFVKICTFFMSL